MIFLRITLTVLLLALSFQFYSYARLYFSPGDPWYVEELKLEQSSIPEFISFDSRRLRTDANCVFMSGETIDDRDALSICNYKSQQIRRDGRPEDVTIPAPVGCEIRMLCDPKDYEIGLKLHYVSSAGKTPRRAKRYAKYYRHTQIDWSTLPDAIKLVPAGGSEVTGTPYFIHVEDGFLCTTKDNRYSKSIDRDLRYVTYLSNLFYDRFKESHPGMWNKESPPPLVKFKLKVKCYESPYTIRGTVSYSLNDKYRPDAGQRSEERYKQSPQQDVSYQDYNSLLQKAIDKDDSQLCEKAKGYVFHGGDYISKNNRREAKNGCYAYFAIQKKELAVCDHISNKNLSKVRKGMADRQYNNCVYQILKSLERFSEKNCLKMKSKGYEFKKCIEEVAKKDPDPELCDRHFKYATGGWHGCRSAQRRSKPSIE